jgi:hypothetical protein
MSDFLEKISEKYADEIERLPTIGSISSFIVLTILAYDTVNQGLEWLPDVSDVLSKNITTVFDKDDGIFFKVPFGCLVSSAIATMVVKNIHSYLNKELFKFVYGMDVISNYVKRVYEESDFLRKQGRPNRINANLIEKELLACRKQFNSINGFNFLFFIFFIISFANVFVLENFVVMLFSVAGVILTEYLIIKKYITKLFPAISVAMAMGGKVAIFGEIGDQ